MKKLLIFLVMGLFLFSFVSAELYSIEIPIDYKAVAERNQNHFTNLEGYLPNNIKELKSVSIELFGDYKNTDVSGLLKLEDGTISYCNPNSWSVGNVDGYKTYFVCDAPEGYDGNLEVGYTVGKDSKNIYGNAIINYDTLEIGMDIHGTEYVAGDEGKVFLQLLDENHQPVKNSTCFASIYYPNDEIFKYQQLMSYTGEGIYDYDVIIPYQRGVYPVSAYCTVPGIDVAKYPLTEGFESGDGTGGSGWDGSWTLDGCTVTTTPPAHIGTYFMECSNDRDPERTIASNSTITTLNYDFHWRAESIDLGEIVYYRLRDASNTVYTLRTVTSSDDDGAWHQETGTLTEDFDGFDFNGDIDFYIETSGNLEGTDWYDTEDINITLTGNVNVTDTEYQIVRGTNELHVSNPDGYEFISNLVEGIMTNNTLVENFTFVYDVVSQVSQNKTDQEIVLEVFSQFPCDHVLDTQLVYANGTKESLPTQFQTNDIGRCEIIAKMDLHVGATYDIHVVTENQWKRTFYYDLSKARLQSTMINITCQNYVLENNLPNFTIPFTQRPDEIYPDTTDGMWYSCGSYLDQYHHFNEVIIPFYYFLTTEYNFTYEEMTAMESNWNHLQKIIEQLDDQANNIFNGLTAAGAYSIALINDPTPPTNPLFATYFASISSSYLNFQYLYGIANQVVPVSANINNTQVADAVWSAPTRELTGFNFAVNVTAEALGNIANAVWNFASRTLTAFGFTVDTTSGNLTAEDVWSFSNRTLSDFDFIVDSNQNLTAEELWTHYNRSLTGSTDVNVNVSEIAESVWNDTLSPARYVHGVELN